MTFFLLSCLVYLVTQAGSFYIKILNYVLFKFNIVPQKTCHLSFFNAMQFEKPLTSHSSLLLRVAMENTKWSLLWEHKSLRNFYMCHFRMVAVATPVTYIRACDTQSEYYMGMHLHRFFFLLPSSTSWTVLYIWNRDYFIENK